MAIGDPLRPGDPARVGPYDLLARLGEGGMGAVYLGRTPGGRLLAIKIIHRRYGGDPDYHARFVRELAAARRVTGAYTAPVLDADTEGASPWVASAFLAGVTVREAVEEFGPLPGETIRALAAGVAEALAGIAAAGVAHRDIKPDNIMLTRDGPRVIDFGIARFAEATAITAAGELVGTPGYIAPEYWHSGESGPAGDVFALGAVLAFCATGRPPFGDGPVLTRLMRAEAGRIDLDGVDDDALRAVILRCTSADPDARPAAADLLGDLGGTGRAVAAPQGVTWLPRPVAAAVAHSAATLDLGGRPSPAAARAVPRRALLAGAGLAAAAAVGGAVSWWPRDDTAPAVGGGGPDPTGSPTLPVPSRSPARATLAWRMRLGEQAPDLGAAGGLILARADNALHALDPRTRKVRWRRDRVRSFLVAGERLVVSNGTDEVSRPDISVLGTASGDEAWRWRPEAPDPESAVGPVLAGSRLLCGTRNKVYVLDAATGRQLWSAKPDGPLYGLAGNDTFMAVASTETLTAYDPAAGTTRWAKVLECDEPRLQAGLLHVRGPDLASGLMIAFRPDGAEAWRRDDGAVPVPDPARPVFYLHNLFGVIRALDAATGREIWRTEMGGDKRAGSSLTEGDTTLVGDVVCVTRNDRIVWAVEQATGAAAWTYQSGRAVTGGVVTDGTLAYVGTEDGFVEAVRIPVRAGS